MKAYGTNWFRSLFYFVKSIRNNESRNIHEDLIKARDAWFRVLSSHKDLFGRIHLPHPAPMLAEQHIEGCYLLPHREAILKKNEDRRCCC